MAAGLKYGEGAVVIVAGLLVTELNSWLKLLVTFSSLPLTTTSIDNTCTNVGDDETRPHAHTA